MTPIALFYSLLLCLWLGADGVLGAVPGCPNCVVRNTSLIEVDGHHVKLTHYVDTSVEGSQPITPVKQVSFPRANARRGAGECHVYPQPYCMCGHQFNCYCQAYSGGAKVPKAADCQMLVNALSVFPEVNGASFTVGVGSYYGLSYQTCEFRWNNPGVVWGIYPNETAAPVEYCYDTLAQLIAGAIDCLQDNSPGQQGYCQVSGDTMFTVGHT